MDYQKDFMRRRPNPIIIDEDVALTIFTKNQIKAAKENKGVLSAKYTLNTGEV